MTTFKISPAATQFKLSGELTQENIDKDSVAQRSSEAAKPMLMGIEQFNLAPPEKAETQSLTAQESLFSPAPKESLSRSFMSILEDLGIEANGIALNEIGKAQLVARLEKMLGKEYSKNPLALDALSAFDKEISKFPMDTKKSLSRMVSNGDRTLKELLKG